MTSTTTTAPLVFSTLLVACLLLFAGCLYPAKRLPGEALKKIILQLDTSNDNGAKVISDR